MNIAGIKFTVHSETGFISNHDIIQKMRIVALMKEPVTKPDASWKISVFHSMTTFIL